MQLTGAEIVIRCLQEEGVEYVFGYPGGAVLNIYDELFKQEQVKHVLVRHEQGAAHAADGYSRSSHKVGVCLVTSGPGVTNAVTGIATAYMDSIPMVVITGQVPTHAIGQDAFQECDTVGITRPCVKHNFLVKDVKDLAVTIKKAFYLAQTGRPGMHGTYESNMAMQHCDVLIAIGSRFDDRVIGNPAHFFRADRKIIHIDIDPSSISKRVKVDVPIVGYVADVLDEMLKLIESSPQRPDPQALKEWWAEIKEWQRKDCLKYDRKSALIKPQYVVEKLYEITGGDAIVTSDVGQHQMWVAQYYKFDKPRRWINSGGLGTMGFGLPAAMGAVLANPGATVACVTGEASIQMCIQELSTCKQYHLPVKIVNLNNKYMGMVRQWQQFFYGNRYAESYMDALPDFTKLAEAYGHVGMKVEKPGDVEGALRDAFKLKDRLVFLDVITDQSENVFPMVPGGKGLTEMILAEEL